MTKEQASNGARHILSNLPICEYGIRSFEQWKNKTWAQVVEEAQSLALTELKAIFQMESNDGRWNSEIKELASLL